MQLPSTPSSFQPGRFVFLTYRIGSAQLKTVPTSTFRFEMSQLKTVPPKRYTSTFGFLTEPAFYATYQI